ncbi:MAG: flagellar basal body-associated protein FliL [Campylobacter sputorum]|uniref:flagellar basal body-associated protein FliL n=1 Tax=Campylobacter sputorum TaxID=206 RepID=UPI000B796CC0|nr:flagellar basal body-associated protein FliL [Campylobacter sputorum]MDY6120655.1 flagellar basal body-associated protein FliL [Campylobacter sputorum]
MMAEEEKEEKKEKKGGSKKVILIIVIALSFVILLVLGVIVGLMLSSHPEQEVPAETKADSHKTQPAPKPNTSVRYSDFMNIGVMYPMDQFVVNLLSESGSRYLKTSIDFELSIETLTPEMDKKKSIIRDIVIRSLSSKTIEEISTTKGKERLKDEIVGKINEILTDGYIKNVYFTDFIIQ